MASWLCRLQPDDLPSAPAWSEEASFLGIAAWVVSIQQEPMELIEQWHGLPLVPSVPLPQGCDVAPLLALLQHGLIWRFQGRPLLLVEGRQVCAAALQCLRREADPWIVSELEGCGEDGLVDRVPLPAAGDRWNYEVLLRRAHWRGGATGWRIPAVRALPLEERRHFIKASAGRYRSWLRHASQWSALQCNGDSNAPVLLETWAGHRDWWQPDHLATRGESEAALLPSQKLSWGEPRPAHLAVMVHGFYFDALDSMLARIPAELRGVITLYVSTPLGQLQRVASLLHHQGWPNVVLFGVVNRGRDIAPFLLQLLPAALEVGHLAFIKLHTKASLHLADGGSWGEQLEAALLAPGLLRGLAAHLDAHPSLGLLGPAGTRVPMSLQLQNNGPWLQRLRHHAGLCCQKVLSASFIAGSMVAGRLAALRPLLDLRLRLDHFEPEAGQTDGTLAHALERWIGVVIKQQGLELRELKGTRVGIPEFGHRWAVHPHVSALPTGPVAVPRYQEPGDFEPFQTQARELCDDGFTVVDLGRDRIAALAKQIKVDLGARFDLEAWRAQGGAVDLRVQDGWRSSSAVRELALLPELQQLLRCCWGREPFAFQTLNFPVGTKQHIHSDAVHFHTEPAGFMCGIWVALEPIHPDAGPLEYLPGSHRFPYLQCRDVGVRQQPGVTPDQRIFHDFWTEAEHRYGLERRRFTPQLGQALIWSANLIHGGAAVNDPARTRWSQVTHYFFEGCRYYTPLLSDWPDGHVAWRQPLDIAREAPLTGADP